MTKHEASLVKRQQNKLIRNERVARQSLDELLDIIKQGKKHKPKLITPTKKSKPIPEQYEVIISDLHYSGEIDDKQVKKFFKKQLEEIHFRAEDCPSIRLSFLGDDIEGELHLSSLDKHQQENTILQVVGVQKHYSNFINSVCNIVGPEKVEVVFVPESNHGQLRFHGMPRGQQPRNDVGYIIRDYLLESTDDKVKFWDSKNGIVETNDAYYMHGDKPFMKSADKVRLVLGKDKHIIMGHWHTMKISQHGNTFLIVAPKATANQESYAVEAGYDNTSAGSLHIGKSRGKVCWWALEEL